MNDLPQDLSIVATHLVVLKLALLQDGQVHLLYVVLDISLRDGQRAHTCHRMSIALLQV